LRFIIKFKLIALIVVLLSLIQFIYLLNYFYTNKNMVDIYQDVAEAPIGAIIKGVTIEQEFVALHNKISAIELLVATYNRTNTGDVDVEITNKSDNKNVLKTKIKASNFRDNTFYRIELPEMQDSKGKLYSIKILSENSKEGDAVTIWASNQDKYLQGKLRINEVDVSKDLKFTIFYNISNFERYNSALNKLFFNPFTVKLFIIALLISFNFLITTIIHNLFLKRNNQEKEEYA
jgi:hypothetical protein